MSAWEFWIDVGGTFTDCIGVDPEGGWHRAKELSSGRIKGRVGAGSEPTVIFDSLRANDPDDFWQGWNFTLLAADGTVVGASRVIQSTHGKITLDAPLPNIPAEHAAYELDCHLDSPVVCIRRILGLGLHATLPPLSVRLGTTRGTNALLTRQGAVTAWVTTKGFGDVLRIGNQARPKLFDLHIRKPETLAPFVLEVDQRTAADGKVLQSMDTATVRQALLRLKQEGVESLAVTLLNSYVNADDEITLGQLAKEIGFTNVSLSHEVSPVIKLLSRGDTTVVDAYLSPVLHDYTRTITQQLGPHAEQLRLMTSAGGLVQADRFQGKDSILSGPAGGVVGFARIAEAAGFAHAIGFDMGGTSTDVARYDGTFEREYETEKAGVRIATPMMAIETVAAGGGSICGFDGVKLTVGPTSAGANPGPACYGQGGPLTVTDINLFLGRLVPDALPFTLNQNVVQQRLQTLAEEIAAQSNRPLSEVELAEGFLQIANHNMAAAVRTISVAKGYDPAEYVLVSFGGAAAQHACAVAEQLNMKAILNHPDAGILSAVGMGLADVRRFATQGIYQPWSEATAQLGVDVFRTLADQATATLAAEERISPERIHLSATIDLRYQNTDAYLTVSFDPSQPRACIELFHQQHRQLYGYETPERHVEVGQIRIEAVGQTSHVLEGSQSVAGTRPQPTATTSMVVRGKTTPVPVYRRGLLQVGDAFSGPAMVLEDYSTTVVDCGWQARVLSQREILLERTDDAPPERATDTATSHESDPVRLELFNRIFESIATQMGVTLQRTSCSVNVKERLDFSCALFTADGNLVVNAPHIPVHLGAMGETVRSILQQHADIQPGDVFISNDPYHGGSHLPDVTVVTPVHAEASDELLFFTASRAHHAEIGGLTPGSMPPFSKSLAEEGVLIRSFKLFDAGKACWQQLRDTLASGTYPSRDIDSNLADVHAQVAANQQGVRDLRRIVTTYGRDTILSYMQHIQAAAEQKMESALAAIADGDYHFEDQMRLASNATACIRVCIRIQGKQATIDFTGTDPVVAGNLNANRAIVRAAVLYVMRCLINEPIPLNEGVFAPLQIILPECLLNPPIHSDPFQCAAVVGGNVETSQRVVDVLLGALGLAAASQGTMNNFLFGNQRFGYYETICGGAGATADGTGADAVHTHMTNTRITDAEVLEQRLPVRLNEFSIRRGSGGAGLHRGGDGVVREFEFLAPLDVSLLTQRRADAPYGLQGGTSGLVGRNVLIRQHGEPQELNGIDAVHVEPGDVIRIETPGGGGWGPANPDDSSSDINFGQTESGKR